MKNTSFHGTKLSVHRTRPQIEVNSEIVKKSTQISDAYDNNQINLKAKNT